MFLFYYEEKLSLCKHFFIFYYIDVYINSKTVIRNIFMPHVYDAMNA